MALQAERQAEVAARIRELRGPKSQAAIAAEIGVTVRAYQRWEAGGGINWENIRPLADALGVSEERLLYGRDEPDPSQLDRIESLVMQLLAQQELVMSALEALVDERALDVSGRRGRLPNGRERRRAS